MRKLGAIVAGFGGLVSMKYEAILCYYAGRFYCNRAYVSDVCMKISFRFTMAVSLVEFTKAR
jgi:hypothetical protein